MSLLTYSPCILQRRAKLDFSANTNGWQRMTSDTAIENTTNVSLRGKKDGEKEGEKKQVSWKRHWAGLPITKPFMNDRRGFDSGKNRI
jgi:hypothetical protein